MGNFFRLFITFAVALSLLGILTAADDGATVGPKSTDFSITTTITE